MRIGVAGLGYVGLCTAVCFSDRGYDVVGVDVDRRKVRRIGEGRSPFFEKGIDSLLTRAVSAGRLTCSDSYDDLIGSQIMYITVGTPPLPDGSIDLSQVTSAAESLGSVIRRGRNFQLVVVKSTVIPGTTGVIVKRALETKSGRRFGLDFGLCSNPEFLREGSALEDTLHPDRIVIGSAEKKSSGKLLSLYKRFYGKALPPVISTNFAMAELIKYANNAFLAMKISYINTMARMCEGIRGADVRELARAIGLDPRIGARFLEAGPGYGGSCLPKDLKGLLNFAAYLKEEVPLLKAVEETNIGQVRRVAAGIKRLLKDVRGRRISILGLSFKAGSDDVRESASIRLIEILLRMKAKVVAYDPKAMAHAKEILGEGISYAKSAEECLKGAELCVVMTAWPEFLKLTPKVFSSLMEEAVVLDARRIYDPGEFSKEVRFEAIGLGR